MRVLLVVDHYPVSPRVQKVANMYKRMDYEIRILSWDRGEEKKKKIEQGVDVFKQSLGYGQRLKKLLNMRNMKDKIKNEIELFHPDIVHAIDFEMAWLSSQLLLRFNNIRLVYEVYDIKFFSNSYINEVRQTLEQKVINYSDLILFASPFFVEYYKENLNLNKPYFVLNNKPSLEQVDISSYKKKHNEKTVISFVGTVRYFDVLKNLILATKEMPNIEVRIYGDGPDIQKVREIEHGNLKLFGRFNVEELPKIYSETDYVWACYPNDDVNVKYAVSNKFFESLYFSKPIFVSEKTYLGSYVRKNNLGLSIDPNSVESVRKVLNNLDSYQFNLPKEGNPEYTWEHDEHKVIKEWVFYDKE